MNEIYQAIYNRLVSQLTESVYDHVPQDLPDSDYPFVRLDPVQPANNDVDDKSGFIATIQVVSYSRYRGSKEIATLADNVYNALHRFDFANTTTYGISDCIEAFRTIKTQPDGLTRNAVQQYQILFEPLPL